MSNSAYKAYAENPEVYVAYGESPEKCLKNMRKNFKEYRVDWWSSCNVQYIEDENLFYMTIYV